MHLTHLPLVPHICVSESGQHVYYWCVQCFDTDNSVQYILMSLFSNKQHPCKKESAKTRKGFILETHFRLNIANGHDDNGLINCIVTSHERNGISNYRPFEIFVLQLVKVCIKESIKATHSWSFVKEIHQLRWFPITKGQTQKGRLCGLSFHVLTS